MTEYPFYYEVRFNVFEYDFENKSLERKITLSKVFQGDNPLENRKKAFIEFNEFLSQLKSTKRLITNSRGNYIIFQPSFLTERLKTITHKDSYSWYERIKKYQEDISVYLIIPDKSVLDALDISYLDTNEFLIHKVASFEFEEQDIVDNLDIVERQLYESFNIDISDILKRVYHYGIDYAESGEDEESGAERTILATPFNWKTKANYLNDILYSSIPKYEIENNNKDEDSYQNYESGTKGVTYEQLFEKYLIGATDIIVTDPYIRLTRQKENFLEFIALIRNLNKDKLLKVNLKLITFYSEGYKQASKDFLDELTEILRKNQDIIHFSYEFKNIHDRTIETSTGWRILLGRGLDIFADYENYLIEKHLPENRRCRDFYIKVDKK